MKLKTILAFATCLATSALAVDTSAQTTQRGVFAFGDSALEQGNRYALPGAAIPPSPPYYVRDGFVRDSNGPVWVEIAYPGMRPILAPGALGRRLNFGFSGAGADRLNVDSDLEIGVDAQIDAFEALIQSRVITLERSDLFYIDAGPNDVFRAFLTGQDINAAGRASGRALAAGAVRLAGLGAKTIFVNDFVDTGLAPLFGYAPPLGVMATEASRQGSLTLRADVRTALGQLPDDVQIVVINSRSLIERMIANPQTFGFNDVKHACFDEIAGTLCSTDPAVQNRFLFIDNAGHPTAPAQEILAKFYLATADSVLGERSAEMRDIVGSAAASVDRHRNVAAARNIEFLTSGHQGWALSASIARADQKNDETVGQARVDDLQLTADFSTETLRFGAVASAAEGTTEAGRLRGDLNDWSVGVYGGWKQGHIFASASALGGQSEIRDLRREIGIPTFVTRSDLSARALAADIKVGWFDTAGPIDWATSIGVVGSSLSFDDVQEVGAAGLDMSFSDVQRTDVSLEWAGQISWTGDLAGAALTARAGFAVRQPLHRDVSGDTLLLNTTARPVSIDRDYNEVDWSASPGLDLQVGEDTTVSADLELSRGAIDQTGVRLKLTQRF